MTSVNNEVVYKLKTDKEMEYGVEIYSSKTFDEEYTLTNISQGYEFIRVSVLYNTKKDFKVKAYKYNGTTRVFSGLSSASELNF